MLYYSYCKDVILLIQGVNMKVLVTGAAGFIGSHTTKRLLDEGIQVVGIDNLNDYYDPALKKARIAWLNEHENVNNFVFIKMDIADRANMEALFAQFKFDRVVHLAAQAGVRYSIENPHAYIESNVVGFTNVLEGCRHHNVEHLVYASSSSVYGANESMPFKTSDSVDHPVSLYAATKKANEAMAHTYSHLYDLPTTGLRFFTVYGPWGRPDMAPFKFAKAIVEGGTIDVYNYGEHHRDFTYIDDIVSGVISTLMHVAKPDPDFDANNPSASTSQAPWRVYNIGAQTPVHLMTFINLMEKAFNQEVKKNLLPMQSGDVVATYADVEDLVKDVGYRPKTTLLEGISEFSKWYKSFY